MGKKTITWFVIFCFAATSNYGWGQSTTNNNSTAKVLKTFVVRANGKAAPTYHVFLEQPWAINLYIEKFEAKLKKLVYICDESDATKCSINITPDETKVGELLKDLSDYIADNIEYNDKETVTNDDTTKANKKFKKLMFYQQYLIDYLYWVGEYKKEKEKEAQNFISFHIGKTFQMIDYVMKKVDYAKSSDGMLIQITNVHETYESAKALRNASLDVILKNRTIYTATTYTLSGNYFRTMYEGAYYQAQNLNMENYVYQELVYGNGNTDMQSVAGKLCNSTMGTCLETVKKHGEAYLAELKKAGIKKKNTVEIIKEIKDFQTGMNTARDIFNAQLKNTRQD